MPDKANEPRRTGQRGRPRDYSDVAIETGHLLSLALGRPWRQTEGLLRSLTPLLGIDVGVPDHTTFSRRSAGLALAASLAQAQANELPSLWWTGYAMRAARRSAWSDVW